MKTILLSVTLLFACQAFSESPEEARFRAQLEERSVPKYDLNQIALVSQQAQVVIQETQAGKLNLSHAATLQQSIAALPPDVLAALLATVSAQAYNQGRNDMAKQLRGGQ